MIGLLFLQIEQPKKQNRCRFQISSAWVCEIFFSTPFIPSYYYHFTVCLFQELNYTDRSIYKFYIPFHFFHPFQNRWVRLFESEILIESIEKEGEKCRAFQVAVGIQSIVTTTTIRSVGNSIGATCLRNIFFFSFSELKQRWVLFDMRCYLYFIFAFYVFIISFHCSWERKFLLSFIQNGFCPEHVNVYVF